MPHGLDTLLRRFDWTDPRHRDAAHRVLSRLGEQGDLEPELKTIAEGLREAPGSLSQRQRDGFFRIVERDARLIDELCSLISIPRGRMGSRLWNPDAKARALEMPSGSSFFMPRMANMREILDALDVDGSETIDLGDGRTIKASSIADWGTAQGQTTKKYREPRKMEDALAVWWRLEAKANERNLRIDPWDYLALIYPDILADMLGEADGDGGGIVIRVPKPMRGIRFSEHTHQRFMQVLQREHLAAKLVDGVGIPEGTRGKQARGEIERPWMKTLEHIANGLAQNAEVSDDDYERYRDEVLRYLIILRLMPFLGRAHGEQAIGLVPVVNSDGSDLFSMTDHRAATRYALLVIRDDHELKGGDGATRARTRLFNRIKNGLYDLRLAITARRLDLFVRLPRLEVTHDDQKPYDPEALKASLDELAAQHARIREHLAMPPEARGGDGAELGAANIARFYARVDRFVQRAMWYTHARGEAASARGSIAYELVPRMAGTRTARVTTDGAVIIYDSDAAEAALDEGWEAPRLEALFAMRAIVARLKAQGVPEGEIEARTAALWPQALEGRLETSRADYIRLESRNRPRVSLGASLHIAERIDEGGRLRPFYLYLDSYVRRGERGSADPAWRAAMHNHYWRHGWDVHLEEDARAAEAYFKAVRHPHYVYDEEKLRAVVEENSHAHDAANRLKGFFKGHNIKFDRTLRHEGARMEGPSAAQLVAWAFADYLAYFPRQHGQGLIIPLVSGLLAEVADRLAREYSLARIGRRVLMPGLKEMLESYNRGLEEGGSAQRLPQHVLARNGLFRSLYESFAREWGAAHDEALPAEEGELLFALSQLAPFVRAQWRRGGTVDDVIASIVRKMSDPGFETPAFFRAWFDRQRDDLAAIEALLEDAAHGIAAFVRAHYRAPMITDADLVEAAARMTWSRFASADEQDDLQEALDLLGPRFEPYLQVKEDVARFLQTAVAHYFIELRDKVRDALVELVEAVGMIGEDIDAPDKDSFVQTLVDLSGYPLPIGEHAYMSVLSHGRLLGLLDGLAGSEVSAIELKAAIDPAVTASVARAEAVREREAAARHERLALQEKARRRMQEAREDREHAAAGEMAKYHDALRAFGRRVSDLQDYSARVYVDDIAMLNDDRLAAYAETVEEGVKRAAGLMRDFEGTVMSMRTRVVGYTDIIASDDLALAFGEQDGVEAQLLAVDDALGRMQRDAAQERSRRLFETARAMLDRLGGVPAADDDIREANRIAGEIGAVSPRYASAAEYCAAWETTIAMKDVVNELIVRLERATSAAAGALANDPQSTIDGLNKVAGDSARTLAERIQTEAARIRMMRGDASAVLDALPAAYERALAMLMRAERDVPAARTVMVAKPIDLRPGLATIPKGLAIRLAEDETLSSKDYKRMSVDVSALQNSLAVLSVEDTGYLINLNDVPWEHVGAWLEGDRQIALTIRGIGGSNIEVLAKVRPVRMTSLRLLASHPFMQHLHAKLKILARSKGPALHFFWSMGKAGMQGDEHAKLVWEQLILRLVDPGLEKNDVLSAVEKVAVSMRKAVKRIGDREWLVNEHKLVVQDVPDDLRRTIEQKSHREIDEEMRGSAVDYVGEESFVAHAQDLYETINCVANRFSDQDPRFNAWTNFINECKTEAGWKAKTEMETFPERVGGFISAVAVWAAIDRADAMGSPHPERLQEKFFDGLKGLVMPKRRGARVDPDAVARYSNLFVEEHLGELFYPDIIYDGEELQWGVEDHERLSETLLDDDVMARNDSSARLLKLVLSSARYLSVGYMLRAALADDAPFGCLKTAVRRQWSEFWRHRPQGDPLSLGMDLVFLHRKARQLMSEGHELPRWWSTSPDEALGRAAPETGRVLWHSVDRFMNSEEKDAFRETVRRTSANFAHHFPAFVNALVIVAQLFSSDSGKLTPFANLYMDVDEATVGGAHLEGKKRDAYAERFRMLYMEHRSAIITRFRKPAMLSGKRVTFAEFLTGMRNPHIVSDDDDDDGGGAPPPAPTGAPSAPPSSAPPLSGSDAMSGMHALGMTSSVGPLNASMMLQGAMALTSRAVTLTL